MRATFDWRLVAVLAIPALGACTTASMRVDVQVYKGPLSKEPAVQLAELAGVLRGAAAPLSGFAEEAKAQRSSSCESPASPQAENALNIYNSFAQAELLASRAETYAKKLGCCLDADCALTCPSEADSGVDAALLGVSDLAAELKLHALNLAYYLESWKPEDERLRIAAINYINLASETSNQLSSRADALLKQRKNGTSASQLAQSIYLRDSAPTSLLNMYVWNKAMNVSQPGDDGIFDSEERRNSVRALEQHFSDHYWSTINTVVASGEGKVGMALVKDDIGNWNLKNYENDPTELLQAYKAVGLASLDIAKDLVGQQSLTGAQKFVALANRFNFGSSAETGASLDELASNLHASTSAALAATASDSKGTFKSLSESLPSKKSDAEKKEQAAASDKQANNGKARDLDGCTATLPGNAAGVSAAAAKSASEVLAALPLKDGSDFAEKARQAAFVAITAAQQQRDLCSNATEARTQADIAHAWLSAWKAESDLAQLPAVTQQRMSELLDAHERTLLELARASQTQAASPAAAKP